MTALTEEQAKKEANEILDFLIDKLENASDQSKEHMLHFLQSASYALGSCIALAASNSSGIGPLMGKTIETLTDGVHAGLQAKGMNGTFIKIVKD
ncbi:hypothetical protein [Paenibacillus durus]|uniref:Uncharacterized protein n=2 Tax=Paenibacillus durus TaxID=44251 RepID=A0A0F7CJF6_PAEDU|nr:hypothetical protein [Paenibacillus durus]AKG36126.1 hypothetical protein VK70_17455 [Paenibacillus durus ATCC 35681]